MTQLECFLSQTHDILPDFMKRMSLIIGLMKILVILIKILSIKYGETMKMGKMVGENILG